MQQTTLDGVRLAAMFQSGYRQLKRNMTVINDLNVFPVPDGDTGTNMSKTLGGGANTVSGDIPAVGDYMQQLAHAVLLSARGNSGVILSQFIRGLANGFADKDTVTTTDLAHAFACAKEEAYNAILTPTEGTMLTVIREAAEHLAENHTAYPGFEECFADLVEQMKQTLAHTPDLLPVLKEAGVVDSGGAGLICVIEGMYANLRGEEVEDTAEAPDFAPAAVTTGSFGPDSVLEYGYCTEFILQLMHAKTDIAAFNREEFVKPLEALGDSIVAVCSGDIVKIHIHTFEPEKVLAYGRQFGEFVTLKIENMSVQHNETVEVASAAKPVVEPDKHYRYAIVAVASGEGIMEYFYGIGATVVINGGQTQNPSVEDFIEAFQSLSADHIVVLPNNSNVVLTAEQAASLYTDTDVRVIPTKSVVEGYSALSMMNPWSNTVEELMEDMTSCLDGVVTGYLTTATRDTCIGGLPVKKDQYIGLDGDSILACGDDKVETALQLIQTIHQASPKEVITVFYGGDVTMEEAEGFKSRLESAYPLCDIGFVDGRQEVYSFIISME